MKALLVAILPIALASTAIAQGALPKPAIAESPTIKVLVGLTVPEFEVEMQGFVQALGINCNYCHVRGNFASEENVRKLTARRHIEMTKGINQQFFAGFSPADGESRLGRVTCFTCHQGAEKPKNSSAPPGW